MSPTHRLPDKNFKHAPMRSQTARDSGGKRNHSTDPTDPTDPEVACRSLLSRRRLARLAIGREAKAQIRIARAVANNMAAAEPKRTFWQP